MAVNFSHLTIKPISKSEEHKETQSVYHMPNLSDASKIIDSRTLKDFKDQVFGGYKLSAASAALDKALMEDKVEPALHWSAQLLLSGTVQPLWNKLITVASKIINVNNPKLPEFLYNKNLAWQQITDNGKYTKDNILLLRNHSTVRLLLAEMIAILALSKKRKLNTLPRIKKEEFIIDTFKSKLVAIDNTLSNGIFQDGDPSEIRIAGNEMAYHLYHGNLSKTLYWLNWILEWEKINTKKYGKYECASRSIEGIDSKFFKDVVWLIWAIINKIRSIRYHGAVSECNTEINTEINNQIGYLWKMYINKFTPAARSRKQPLIIWSILCMVENVDMKIPLVDRPHVLFQSLLGMDKIIATLKSQEVHHVVNNDLLNVIVENNYMMPENYKQLEAYKLRVMNERQHIQKEQEAQRVATAAKIQSKTQSNVNVQSLQKLNDVYKLDKMMYA